MNALPYKQLEVRRRQLGMSVQVLARLSGTSSKTVQRVLMGNYATVGFGTVQSIARALGLAFGVQAISEVDAMREARAREKAESLVGLVQGTSALEAQGISDSDCRQIASQMRHQLLAGSPRRLWE